MDGIEPHAGDASAAPPAHEFDRAYALIDRYRRDEGRVFVSGTQALVRLLLLQAASDRRLGLKTAGFVSGYRGSPLGGVDQEMWAASAMLEAAGVRFLPAVNEELAATAVLGAQQVEADPERTVEGVFALWYGKGPGVDRAGDALKHGNAYGSSPHGGVLVVMGDDHGCVSSSMPHQSEQALMSFKMPILDPANIEEFLEFGLYGWALSRYCGAWVGFKAISETVEGCASVVLPAVREYTIPTDYAMPADGLNIRWPDLPGLAIEVRSEQKLRAVAAFARANPIDRVFGAEVTAKVGIIAAGKAWLDFREALAELGTSVEALVEGGVRIYKPGLIYPLEATRLLDFARGLDALLVIEEKAAVIEDQVKSLLFNRPDRPLVCGKRDEHGTPLISSLGELRASRLVPILAQWLDRHASTGLAARALSHCEWAAAGAVEEPAAGPKRTPYFCSGCPHNTSTRVPEGSRALAGIGCHFMANWMDRSTTGLTQMGGEGVNWVAQSLFTKTPHVFQNLGDGTYYHSGHLAVRQAIAAGANMTYKVLFNDAVAMTGGQPVDGPLSVEEIAHALLAEGAQSVDVVTDEPQRYRNRPLPAGVIVHHRRDLDAVQRRLRETRGVTILIYDQTCAAEKRRRRKRGEYPDPAKRLFIHPEVCEGCGDCGTKSNCLSILPLATPLGQKREIDQSSCNKDYSCADGFCPSFVTVKGGALRKGSREMRAEDWVARALQLPEPRLPDLEHAYNLLVTGVGGTGVVTVGMLVAMAAHLEGLRVSTLDFMGFAQKGGAVLCHVRLAPQTSELNQARIDIGQADAVIACDLVVATSPDALMTMKHGHTRVVANEHETPTAEFTRDRHARVDMDGLFETLSERVGTDSIFPLDAQALAREKFGDTATANVILLGAAWQRGLIPLAAAAIERAVELNGVALEPNRRAFALGRLYAAGALTKARGAVERAEGAQIVRLVRPERLDEMLVLRGALLARYQNAQYARRYLDAISRLMLKERALGTSGDSLTRIAAHQLARLMAYKDEYEVARLFTEPQFKAMLAARFEGEFEIEFNLAVPLLARKGADGLPMKSAWGGATRHVFRGLSVLKFLRGTPLDPFGYSAERRAERELITRYISLLEHFEKNLSLENLAAAKELAQLPDAIRGYGHIKQRNLDETIARWDELRAAFDRGEVNVPEVRRAQAAAN